MKVILQSLCFLTLVLCFSVCSKTTEKQSFLHSVLVSAQAPQTFEEAKKVAWKIFAHHPLSLYCGCRFNSQGEVQTESCPYKPTVLNARTYKIQWEHIVPAKKLGEDLACWHHKLCVTQAGKPYKGRACCRKNKVFQRREADLHNLVPALGPLNQARGTLPFGILKSSTPDFMGCALKISRKEGMVEPPASIRGVIARVYLYMQDQHGIHLSKEEKLQYEQWHQQYPVDNWELEWDYLIQKVQGNSNPYREAIVLKKQ